MIQISLKCTEDPRNLEDMQTSTESELQQLFDIIMIVSCFEQYWGLHISVLYNPISGLVYHTVLDSAREPEPEPILNNMQ